MIEAEGVVIPLESEESAGGSGGLTGAGRVGALKGSRNALLAEYLRARRLLEHEGELV